MCCEMFLLRWCLLVVAARGGLLTPVQAGSVLSQPVVSPGHRKISLLCDMKTSKQGLQCGCVQFPTFMCFQLSSCRHKRQAHDELEESAVDPTKPLPLMATVQSTLSNPEQAPVFCQCSKHTFKPTSFVKHYCQ